MHFLIKVVADELSHTQNSFLLYVEDFVVDQNIRVLIEVEGIFNPINVRFELLEPVILNLREV